MAGLYIGDFSGFCLSAILQEVNFKSLWRGEGTDYIAPAVAGSNPVGGASRRSSMAEQWRNFPGRRFPPQKYSSVVKARVTSVERSGANRRGCEFDARSPRKGR